jgi:hypothetical protein
MHYILFPGRPRFARADMSSSSRGLRVSTTQSRDRVESASEILTTRLAILSEDFYRFPQSLQTNAGIMATTGFFL